MEYYLVKLEVRQGDYEHAPSFLLRIATREKAMKRAEKVASTWYGDADNDDDTENDYYMFNGGEVAVIVCSLEAISELEYVALKKFINDHTK